MSDYINVFVVGSGVVGISRIGQEPVTGPTVKLKPGSAAYWLSQNDRNLRKPFDYHYRVRRKVR